MLTAFVTHVLTGAVRLHEARANQPWELVRHRPGKLPWTTRTHWLAEQHQIDATAAAAAASRAREARRAVKQK